MSAPTLIYLLHDPTDVSQRVYIGKTTHPADRMRKHIQGARRGGRQLSSRWLRRVLARGVRPEMVTLEVVPPGGDWQEAERFWIESLRAMGASMANQTLGGEGATGYRFSPEKRAEMGLRAMGRGRGRRQDPRWIEARTAPRRGKLTPKMRAAVEAAAKAMRGRSLTGDRYENHLQGKGKFLARGKLGLKGVRVNGPGFSAKLGTRYLGTFPTAERAALAYDEAARLKWGRSAALNFPGPGERAARRPAASSSGA